MVDKLLESAYLSLYDTYKVDSLISELKNKIISIKYSNSFKGYNANVKYSKTFVNFHLSSLWKDVSFDIKVGLIQSLLMKVHNIKNNILTINLELYNIFMKKLHQVVVKDRFDPILLDSFNRNNLKYFNNSLDVSNLVWGQRAFSRFGSYNFSTDTITISSIFKEFLPDVHLLDYVMYHEMLHKKLKFNSSSNRRNYHTSEFRRLESLFFNQKSCELELKKIYLKNKKLKKNKGFFRVFDF